MPISALFVLLVGEGHTLSYVAGYLGLTFLGAIVGVAVNLLFPPLMLGTTRLAQDALRELLVAQLHGLADALDPDVGERGSVPRAGDLGRRRVDVQDLVGEALSGPPVNWRVWRTRGRVEHLRRRGDTLLGLAVLVGELDDGMAGDGVRPDSWGADIERAAVRALRATADVVEPDADGDLSAEMAAAEAATSELAARITDAAPERAANLFSAAALLERLRRTNQMLSAHAGSGDDS